MVIFKSKQNKFEGDLKIKVCGKRLYPTESVKYLGVKIDTNLSQQYHINDIFIKPQSHKKKVWKRHNFFCLCYVSALTSAQSFHKGTKSSGKFQ